MEIKASVEAGDMEYAVAERQADRYSALLAAQEASMSELISTEIPITVRTFLWLLLIVSLSILVALARHIKALVLNNRKHACELGVLSTCTLLLYSDFCVYTCLLSLHFPDLLPFHHFLPSSSFYEFLSHSASVVVSFPFLVSYLVNIIAESLSLLQYL
jgi:hypothetical protein